MLEQETCDTNQLTVALLPTGGESATGIKLAITFSDDVEPLSFLFDDTVLDATKLDNQKRTWHILIDDEPLPIEVEIQNMTVHYRLTLQ
ncbi:hypothetical protein [Thaumasiovibrio sp. DFM-14]|uniref:hypothetical protein n=1 Tax=Thaumasiovibrio sp. DFM-14 TaxID=3384792 RepID=UPI00399EF33A